MADAKLTEAEVKDERDTSPRAARSEPKGKRVRAIPAKGGTKVEVRPNDFKVASRGDIEHGLVVFDFRDKFQVEVGNKDGQLSQKAADFLTKNYPESFEFIDE